MPAVGTRSWKLSQEALSMDSKLHQELQLAALTGLPQSVHASSQTLHQGLQLTTFTGLPQSTNAAFFRYIL